MKQGAAMKSGGFAKVAKPPKGPKLKKCKICREPFMPRNIGHVACKPDCAQIHGAMVAAKQKAKAQRQERAEIKAKLREYETIPQLKSRLQDVFNLFIRLRDAEYPCICCGKWPKSDVSLRGGQWDACHWKGRGAHDHLRYNEDNVHKGLKDCNKYGHTDYRGRLVNRIGIDRVEALESYQPGGKWTREWLLAKIAEYSAKVKELKGKL